MRRLVSCALLLAGCSGPVEFPREEFSDITAPSRVDFVHDAGQTEEKQLPETMGSGAAIVDVDEDGDLDLYFVQSGPLPIPGKPRPKGAPTNRLFLNDGKARFRDATRESGDAAQSNYGMGVACGDANGDGHGDFYLTNLGPDVLLFGDGHARFRDVTASSGITGDEWTTGAAFFDADDDGDLDLFVTTYLSIDLARPLWCGERRPGWRSYCHPDAYPGLEDHFWKNNGDGTFVEATKEAGFSDPNGKGLCVAASDLDGDSHVDLYVANDSTENRYYHNLGNGRFEDATLLSGLGVDAYGRTEASMGIAIGDVDGDGDLDVFVTGFDDESDTLYQNQGKGRFEDITLKTGLEIPTRLPVGFGCVLENIFGESDLDLAIANGHIIDNIELYADAKTYRQKALLFRGADRARFEERPGGALTETTFVGRGLYSGDLDGDGCPELVLTQCGGPARILRFDATHTRTVLRGLPWNTRVLMRLDDKDGNDETILREAGPKPSYLGQCASEVYVPLRWFRQAIVELRLRLPGKPWQVVKLEQPLAEGVHTFVREGDTLRLLPSAR